MNDVGNGVGQWAEELSKTAAGAAEVLGGVVQKAGETIKAGKLVSTAGHSHCAAAAAVTNPWACCCVRVRAAVCCGVVHVNPGGVHHILYPVAVV